MGFSVEQACFFCVVKVEQLEVSPDPGDMVEQTAPKSVLRDGWSTEQPVKRWMVEHDPMPSISVPNEEQLLALPN